MTGAESLTMLPLASLGFIASDPRRCLLSTMSRLWCMQVQRDAFDPRVQVFPFTQSREVARKWVEGHNEGDTGRDMRAVHEHCEDVNVLFGMTNEVVLRCKFRRLALLSIVAAVKVGTSWAYAVPIRSQPHSSNSRETSATMAAEQAEDKERDCRTHQQSWGPTDWASISRPAVQQQSGY